MSIPSYLKVFVHTILGSFPSKTRLLHSPEWSHLRSKDVSTCMAIIRRTWFFHFWSYLCWYESFVHPYKPVFKCFKDTPRSLDTVCEYISSKSCTLTQNTYPFIMLVHDSTNRRKKLLKFKWGQTCNCVVSDTDSVLLGFEPNKGSYGSENLLSRKSKLVLLITKMQGTLDVSIVHSLEIQKAITLQLCEFFQYVLRHEHVIRNIADNSRLIESHPQTVPFTTKNDFCSL